MTIAAEEIRRPVILVRAALSCQDELTAGRTSKFGGVLICKQREFLNCFRRDVNLWSCYSLVVIVNTIDDEVVVPRALATDRASRSNANATRAGNVRGNQRQVINT